MDILSFLLIANWFTMNFKPLSKKPLSLAEKFIATERNVGTKMAAPLVGGAALGAALGVALSELLKAVKDAKTTISSFKPILKSLESTLTAITPCLDEITLLNKKHNQSETGGTTELDGLIRDGKELVDKCSQISRRNIIKKGQYFKQLRDFDFKLSRYFVTVLQLHQYKEIKKIQVALNQLRCKDDLENNPDELVVETRDEASSSNCDKTAMTRKGKAREALLAIEDGNQRADVRNRLDSFNSQYGSISTKFVLYNATGDTVNLVRTEYWSGYVYEPYRLQIENGQWGVYFHVATLRTPYVAVVFRGKNLKDEYRDWMFLWVDNFTYVDVAAGTLLKRDNCVYTEIHEAKEHDTFDYSEYFNGLLSARINDKKHKDKWNGCSSSVTTTETGTTVVVEAILTLKLD